MKNPNTSIIGLSMLVLGLIIIGQKLWNGIELSWADLQSFVTLLSGIGLVAAKDGGT